MCTRWFARIGVECFMLQDDLQLVYFLLLDGLQGLMLRVLGYMISAMVLCLS